MFQSKIEEEQSQSEFSNGFFFRPRSELHYDENANTLVRLYSSCISNKNARCYSVFTLVKMMLRFIYIEVMNTSRGIQRCYTSMTSFLTHLS